MYLVAQRSACAVGTYNLYNSADVYMSGPYVISMNLSIDSLFQFNVLYQGILDDANSQVLLSSSGNVTSQIKIENNDTYMGVSGSFVDCSLYTNFAQTLVYDLDSATLLITLSCESIKCTSTQCYDGRLIINSPNNYANGVYLSKI